MVRAPAGSGRVLCKRALTEAGNNGLTATKIHGRASGEYEKMLSISAVRNELAVGERLNPPSTHVRRCLVLGRVCARWDADSELKNKTGAARLRFLEWGCTVQGGVSIHRPAGASPATSTALPSIRAR